MKASKWINSKTRLPELDKFVIVSWKNISTIGFYNKGAWSVMENMNNEQPVDWDYNYIVDKWMELPV